MAKKVCAAAAVLVAVCVLAVVIWGLIPPREIPSALESLETSAGDVKDGIVLDSSTLFCMQFIESSKLEKLYTFNVTDQVLDQLGTVMKLMVLLVSVTLPLVACSL